VEGLLGFALPPDDARPELYDEHQACQGRQDLCRDSLAKFVTVMSSDAGPLFADLLERESA
jgi:hypothetical protein